MPADTLSCPRCQARLRRGSDLEPGTAVVCPRCQAQFTAPDHAAGRGWAFGAASSTLVQGPAGFPDRGQPHPLPEADPDAPEISVHLGPFGPAVTLHVRIACLLEGLGILAALYAAFVEVTSITVSGPLLSLVGLYVAGVSLWKSFLLGIAAGLSALGVSVLCFGLIVGFRWGPVEATGPVRVLGSLYAVVMIPLLSWIALSHGTLKAARNSIENNPLHRG